MFGLLDLNSCGLEREKRSFYFCNVCNALASKFGRASRLMLTNDSVYLSLLLAGQRTEIPYGTTTPSSCRPWSRDAVCMPEFTYPAAVSVLIAGVGLIDNLHDAPSIQSKVQLAVWKPKITQAEQQLRELGLNLPSLTSLVEEQHRREAVAGRGLTYYSGTTEEMYSKVFAHTAMLADAPGNAAHLAEVGRNVGRVAYLLDNYADLQKDKPEGCFNIFNQPCPSVDSAVNPRQLFTTHVSQSLLSIREKILKVKLNRFQRTIRYTVTEGLWAKVRRTIMAPEIIVSRPIVYAMLPVAMGLLMHGLQSSGGDDCCGCSGGTIDCGQLCSDYIEASIEQAIARTVTNAVYGAGAAVAGGVSAIAVSAIASHIHPSAPADASAEEPPVSAETAGDSDVSVQFSDNQTQMVTQQSNADYGGPPESGTTASEPGPLDTDNVLEGLSRTGKYIMNKWRQGSEAGRDTEDWAQRGAPPEQPGGGPTFWDSLSKFLDWNKQGRETSSLAHDTQAAQAYSQARQATGGPVWGSERMVNAAANSPGGISDEAGGNGQDIIDQVNREKVAKAGEITMHAWAVGATVGPKLPEALHVPPGQTPAMPETGVLVPGGGVGPPVTGFTPAQPTGQAGVRAATVAAEGVTHTTQTHFGNPVDAYTSGVFQESEPAHSAWKQFSDIYHHEPNPKDPTDRSNYVALLKQVLGKGSAEARPPP
jgi:hypothetical protein